MSAPFDLIPPLLGGLWVTLQIAVGAALVAAGAALLAGLGKLSPYRAIRWPAVAYIEVFRGTSALVQLFWFYFVLPFFGLELSAMTAGILVLGLNTGAYGAEVVRGAIQAVPPGQCEAAAALSLSPAQTMQRIVLPQAVVAMLPPAGNLMIETLKNTALVSLITITDLTFIAQILRADTLRTEEIFTMVLIMYFLVALLITVSMRLLERKVSGGLDHGGIR
ncbi:MAG: ectoine/hydroxyectoine ABC transporter permease subunit EhuC [Betaproteobacteria bacterium RIFCSPLOWO2_12_FULL_62_13]|nr:MAG: ectoine/hydroxyectoine ABC transporter permease subunit EhuC [Betaproteobacteria bacterium RIFCSPLOWO2_12_FULL_62_13]